MFQLLINQQQSMVKRLEKIIRRARENNPNLPIYVIGIYNPFYLNFPELTDMQLVVDKWNQETESRTRKFSGVLLCAYQ